MHRSLQDEMHVPAMLESVIDDWHLNLIGLVDSHVVFLLRRVVPESGFVHKLPLEVVATVIKDMFEDLDFLLVN